VPSLPPTVSFRPIDLIAAAAAHHDMSLFDFAALVSSKSTDAEVCELVADVELRLPLVRAAAAAPVVNNG
jgi:hypothetical protein